MAGFKIDLFKGIRPRISSRKLPVGEGQTAENTKLGSGDLKPWKDKDAGTALVNTFYNRTIYRFDNGGSPLWFEWNDYVDVARGPVKDDALERTYYTGDSRGTGAPRYTYTTIADGGGGGPYPEDFRYLGVPAPAAALNASVAPLAEDKPQSERHTDHTVSSVAIQTDELEIASVNWVVYPGSGSDDGTWQKNAGDLGGIVFHVAEGSEFRVTEVVDDDNIRLGSVDKSGVFVKTPSNDKASVSYWSLMDRGGTSTQQADFLGWRIPDGALTRIINHNLRVGDVIRVRETNLEYGLHLSHTFATQFYEQDWPSEEQVTEDDETFFKVVNARISASAVSGATSFDIAGGFHYDVLREESTNRLPEDRTYVYTYVTSLGEEGPPSPASNIILALDGDPVSLQGMASPPTTGYDITNIRIYRTNSTEAGTEFQFVKEIDVVTDTTDSVEGIDLGEVIESTTYDAPPEGMKGITTLPNGMMVGFVGKGIHMCEPYLPHAWPPEYDQAVDYEIVGLASFGNSVAVLTKGYPYILTGAHPRNVNIIPLKIKQACESKESIATDVNNVYYASPDGLVEITVNGVRLVTEHYFDKEDWASYSPSLMVSEFHDGKYFGFFDGVANVSQPASAALTGTVISSTTEADIQSGGQTLIITLTGDTWVASGATFNAQRQNIIDGLNAALDPDTGWNAEVRDNEVVGAVVRTSDTIVTITLSAAAAYSIGVAETITVTVPATALVTSSVSIIADSTFSVAALSDYGSLVMVVTDEDDSDTEIAYGATADGDINGWPENSGFGFAFKHEVGMLGVAYSPPLSRWLAVGQSGSTALIPGRLIFSTSDDNGQSWTPRDHNYELDESDKVPRWAIWDRVISRFIVVGDSGHLQVSPNGASWTKVSINPAGSSDDLGQLAIGDNDAGVGHYVYAADKTQEKLLRSPNLATRPATDTWNFATFAYTGDSTGSRFLASGNGVFIAVGTDTTDMDLARCVHGSLTGNDVGTISTYNCAGIVFGNELWVTVSTDFRIITCAAGDENTIGNWSSPSSSKDANVTINGIIYDEGDGITQGFGYIAFGYVTASGLGVVYTSPDAATWTLRHTFSEDVEVVAAAGRNPESDLGA